nr:zinc knuckle CX2CX4HX4C [Tanacetum cinerariifolium]
MVELRADEELKDTLIVIVSKFAGKGYTMITICVEYEWKPPRCSSFKKQAGLTRHETSTPNQFDAIYTVENDDELGMMGKSKLAEKGANFDVVSSTHWTSFDAFGNPDTTPIPEMINELER